MDQSFDIQLISDVSQCLNTLAKAIGQAGDAERADKLFQQAAELELGSPELQNCWGGPLNGQSGRQALVLDLLRLLDPAAVIETGAFRGITTAWLAENYRGTVLSCEKEKVYYLQAKARLAELANADLYLEDSRLFLRKILTELPTEKVLLFYLDAHWEVDLPIREELQIIFERCRNAVVLIDDFRVPDDPGYGWDFYGPEKSIDLTLLEGVIPSDSKVFFPSLPSSQETGAVRGCCVIAAEAAAKIVAENALLRSKSLHDWAQIERDSGPVARNTDESTGVFDEPPLTWSLRADLDKERKLRLSQTHSLVRELEQLRPRLSESEDDRSQLRSQITHLNARLSESENDRSRLSSELACLNERLSVKIGKFFTNLLSPISRAKQRRKDSDYIVWIDFVYRSILGRPADEVGMKAWLPSLQNGMPFSHMVREIEASREARTRGQGGTLEDLSDGEFILSVAELLFQGRGATPREIEQWKSYLGEIPAKRAGFVRDLIGAHIIRQQDEGDLPYDSQKCWIMGTDRFLTTSTWRQRAEKLGLAERNGPERPPAVTPGGFRHTGDYTVSAIASLYKGRRFLEKFLDNITSQSIFDRSELIIIDADSPEGEQEMIAEYQKTYPNIVYKRINYRIGIYDAWNIGVQMARGTYLTNTNVDDLRRKDSFELQAAALDQHPFADVVYQDFFYSFDPSLSFDEIAMFDFRSQVPIVTPHNLLTFNSPHNAPMWRKALHDEVGLFDTSFKSAGDWEFWLRCISRGKNFFKINTPHVVYFQNPEGVSTRPDTRGIEEARDILRRYSRKLISKRLTKSREEFAKDLKITPDWGWGESYYDVVQNELRRLGERRKARPPKFEDESARMEFEGSGSLLR